MTDTLPITDRTRLRRMHQFGSFDRATVNAILGAQPICSVGYVINGKPYVTPTLQWREGDRVYWHGSSASRALRQGKGHEVCLNVIIVDGYMCWGARGSTIPSIPAPLRCLEWRSRYQRRKRRAT